MSILDLPYESKEELDNILKGLPYVMEMMKGRFNLQDEPVFKALEEGYTLAEIKGITTEELEGIYSMGFQHLNNGDLEKAEDVFQMLIIMEPLDARFYYCMGTIFQLRGNAEVAAKQYIQFLGLDATSSAGYMRLGECLMASREIKEALDCFTFAKMEAERGNGPAETIEQAQAMIDHIATLNAE